VDERTTVPVHRFLRVEVFDSVARDLRYPIHVEDNLQVVGHLMWDGDGFLEIHPSVSTDIRVLKQSASR
jgi:hypothetical protein